MTVILNPLLFERFFITQGWCSLKKCKNVNKVLKGHIVWSFTLHNLWQMWSGHVLWLSYMWPRKLDWEYSCFCPWRFPEALSFHDRHPTLAVAHTGTWPHHTVKMLPDGFHILLLAASVVQVNWVPPTPSIFTMIIAEAVWCTENSRGSIQISENPAIKACTFFLVLLCTLYNDMLCVLCIRAVHGLSEPNRALHLMCCISKWPAHTDI